MPRNRIEFIELVCFTEEYSEGCLTRETLRYVIAFGCVVAGIWLHFGGTVDFAAGLFLWIILAGTAGYLLPHGWMIVIAPLPWVIGVGGGVLIGQHDGFGEVWYISMVLSTFAGLIGVIMGASARRGRTRTQTGSSS